MFNLISCHRYCCYFHISKKQPAIIHITFELVIFLCKHVYKMICHTLKKLAIIFWLLLVCTMIWYISGYNSILLWKPKLFYCFHFHFSSGSTAYYPCQCLSPAPLPYYSLDTSDHSICVSPVTFSVSEDTVISQFDFRISALFPVNLCQIVTFNCFYFLFTHFF